MGDKRNPWMNTRHQRPYAVCVDRKPTYGTYEAEAVRIASFVDREHADLFTSTIRSLEPTAAIYRSGRRLADTVTA